MSRSVPKTRDAATGNAEARFRQLIDELRLLAMDFPHLREAFDREDLPVSFLLKRGADRAARRLKPPTKPPAKRAARARRKAHS